MRKRFIIILFKSIFLLICKPTIARSQNYLHFDDKKSCSILYKQLMKGDNWMSFSDDDKGEVVFKNKHAFKVKAVLKCIAVMKIDEKTFNDIDNKYIYINDTSIVYGFLLKKGLPIAFAKAIQIDYLGGEYIGQYTFERHNSKNLKKLYSTSLEENKTLFLDNSLHGICYYNDDKYYRWDDVLSKFIVLGNANDIKEQYIKYYGGGHK